MKKIEQIVVLLTCFAIMLVAAVQRDGRIWGHAIRPTTDAPVPSTTTSLPNQTLTINTTTLGKDIVGYAGPVPLEIYIKDGKIISVHALKNNETPEFFKKASQLFALWEGKSIAEAQALEVDGVSGATYSSRAIIGNMQAGLHYAAATEHQHPSEIKEGFQAKTIAGLIVVLMAALVPLFYRSKRYRRLQLLLNVIVLGLWSGTFLNWSMWVGYCSNGIHIMVSLVPIVMLITAFVYPLFGKKHYYCTHVCPFGSLQELAGQVRRQKWKLGKTTVKYLNYLRQILLAVLLMAMLVGVGFEWMDYELFSAFIFQSAAGIVIAFACVVVVLSVFIPRPYCRFVCPTGTFLKWAEGSSKG